MTMAREFAFEVGGGGSVLFHKTDNHDEIIQKVVQGLEQTRKTKWNNINMSGIECDG